MIGREFVMEHQALISIAEACWKQESPSYSWHVVDWMAWKLRLKYPPVIRGSVITMTST